MTHLLSVDLQNEFASTGGACYQPRACVNFIKQHIFPYCIKKNISIVEIISDYRLPLIKATKDKCVPGSWGYTSLIPQKIKKNPIRIKSLQSPCRIRENGGNKEKKAGAPYHDPKAFDQRLENVGISTSKDRNIVLFGLTLDCCVLCVAQELHWRKFNVFILEEGTDTYWGTKKEKESRLKNNIFYWAKRITRKDTKKLLDFDSKSIL